VTESLSLIAAAKLSLSIMGL